MICHLLARERARSEMPPWETWNIYRGTLAPLHWPIEPSTTLRLAGRNANAHSCKSHDGISSRWRIPPFNIPRAASWAWYKDFNFGAADEGGGGRSREAEDVQRGNAVLATDSSSAAQRCMWLHGGSSARKIIRKCQMICTNFPMRL